MITRDGNQLRVQGALTIASVAALAETGKQQFGDAGELIVDLAAVTELDSAALSLIFEWQREARRRSITIRYCNLPASLQSLAKLYGVAELIAPVS